MTRADLAARLTPVLLDPEAAAGLDVHGRIDAAVLVALFAPAGGGLHVVLTKRRDDLRRHAGEISFPGGRQDTDETDLRTTALREARAGDVLLTLGAGDVSKLGDLLLAGLRRTGAVAGGER